VLGILARIAKGVRTVSIYRRKGSPHWWINISIAGRKTRRTTRTEDRGKAQEYEAAERERLWRVHQLGDRSAIRWTEAAAQWLESIPEKSRYKEESILNWFDEEIRDEPIGSITREAVIELREDLRAEGKGTARTDRYMANLRAVLRKAVENGHLVAAPHVPMYNERSEDFRWLTHEEFARLKKELPEHLALAAQFAVWTGLRMRSMLNLTWDRVDLRNSRFWIPGQQMKGRHAHGVPISRDVKRVFRQLKTLSPAGMRVFQYRGESIDDCNTLAFQKAVERAGVGPLRWHDLRHTFASWAVQSGVTLPELMAIGNWKTYSCVLRYAHLAPDHLAQAAEKIARSGHSRKRGST
jgi:integrase